MLKPRFFKLLSWLKRVARWSELQLMMSQQHRQFPIIKKLLIDGGYGDVPIIGDFHYNGHTLLEKYPDCASALDKYRINPGNVGYGDKHDPQF